MVAAKAGAALINVAKPAKIAGGFKELLGHAGVGALFSGGLTTLYTGNPLIGAAVGAADLFGSAGAAHLLGKTVPKWAGGYTKSIPTDAAGKALKGAKAVNTYSPSMPQHIAMGVTSIAAPTVLEPMLRGGTEPPYTSPQYVDQRGLGDLHPNFQQVLNSSLNDPELKRRQLVDGMFTRYGL